jgi:hypothetical protein
VYISRHPSPFIQHKVSNFGNRADRKISEESFTLISVENIYFFGIHMLILLKKSKRILGVE